MTTTTASASQGVLRHSIVALFIAGFISVLVFQNGFVAILHALGWAPPPFRYDPTKPLSVPQIWSGAFWGGIWGIVFGLIEKRFPKHAMYYVACFLFGILPTLVLWCRVPDQGPADGGRMGPGSHADSVHRPRFLRAGHRRAAQVVAGGGAGGVKGRVAGTG
jgi:hypothetical protein